VEKGSRNPNRRLPGAQQLRDYAGIHDEAIVAGVNNNLELWSPDEWAVEKASSQVQAWQIIESLEQK
jgi:DNA-binding transcriptional regulator/RsmH inhibitor MraZ